MFGTSIEYAVKKEKEVFCQWRRHILCQYMSHYIRWTFGEGEKSGYFLCLCWPTRIKERNHPNQIIFTCYEKSYIRFFPKQDDDVIRPQVNNNLGWNYSLCPIMDSLLLHPSILYTSKEESVSRKWPWYQHRAAKLEWFGPPNIHLLLLNSAKVLFFSHLISGESSETSHHQLTDYRWNKLKTHFLIGILLLMPSLSLLRARFSGLPTILAFFGTERREKSWLINQGSFAHVTTLVTRPI